MRKVGSRALCFAATFASDLLQKLLLFPPPPFPVDWMWKSFILKGK